MYRIAVLAIIFVTGTSLWLATPAAAAPKHVQVGQEWTVELQTAPGPEGACVFETIGPSATLTFEDGTLSNGKYIGGGMYLRESFDDQDGNTFAFHGPWSPSLSEYVGTLRVRGLSGFLADGKYPGYVVPGKVPSWGGSPCT